jgi:hypothetical protein
VALSYRLVATLADVLGALLADLDSRPARPVDNSPARADAGTASQ